MIAMRNRALPVARSRRDLIREPRMKKKGALSSREARCERDREGALLFNDGKKKQRTAALLLLSSSLRTNGFAASSHGVSGGKRASLSSSREGSERSSKRAREQAKARARKKQSCDASHRRFRRFRLSKSPTSADARSPFFSSPSLLITYPQSSWRTRKPRPSWRTSLL